MDDPITEQSLLAEARHADERRAADVAELAAAAPELDKVTLSPGALGVLCELLTMAMAQRESTKDAGSAEDQIRGLTVRIEYAEGETTQVRSTGGTLTLRDSRLVVQ
jgi:hypothetical protein